MMNLSHKQKVEEIFEAALDYAPDEQTAFLAAECKNQPKILAEVKSLLAARAEAGDNSFLNAPAYAMQAHYFAAEDAKENLPEQTFGHYKIVERIGAGGMGTVYKAVRDDGEYKTEVAVKLIKRGMDTEHILNRFKTERQILANLNHPHIARLLEGGTTDNGLPYFVMEYIKGRPLNEYCDERELSVKERLELFRAVCSAVQYAHQNLVIHRDIKPSNILVTSDGTPKLLDFGIAKILHNDSDDETALTATELRVLTPEYASPEQVKGETVNVSSDVYSLGVVLYELLTGHRPYHFKSRRADEIARIICEQEPEKPSTAIYLPTGTGKVDGKEEVKSISARLSEVREGSPEKLRRKLRGDLDNIVLTAMRKETARRYASVEKFSEDIRRHLAGLPVTARKDTWNYRAEKFVRRNSLVVGFTALVVLALLGGIAATTWQARRATRERVLAERRFENLRKMSNSISSEIHTAIRDLPGSLPARQLLITRGVEQLDALAEEAADNPSLQADLASAYQNLGVLPDKPLAERREIYLKAAAMYQKILDGKPDDVNARMQLAQCYFNLADFSRTQGDLLAALDYNRKSIPLVESVLKDEPDEPKHQVQFWGANYNLALTLYQMGNAAEVVETARKVLPVAENLRLNNPTGTDKYNYLRPQQTRAVIAESLNYAGDYQNALKEFELTLALCETELALQPNETIITRNLAITHRRMASALENAGDAESALRHLQISRSALEKLKTENPKNYDYPTYLAHTEISTGQFFLRQNQAEKAVAHFRRALELNEIILATDAARGQNRSDAAQARANLGYALASSGKPEDGLNYLREAAAFYEQVNAAASPDAHLKRGYAETLSQTAQILERKNNQSVSEAGELFRRSSELWQDLQARGVLRHADFSQAQTVARRLSQL